MPAVRKVSLLQMEVLVSHMEEHRVLARGPTIVTPRAKAAVRQQWEELAIKLNAIIGHRKSANQWREYWRDIKYRVKKKAGAQEVCRRETGRGPLSTEVLTAVEERIFAVIGKKAVLGDDEEEIPREALPSPPLLRVKVERCFPAGDVPAPLVVLAPLPSPLASQPSTSRAPSVEEPPSAAAGDAPTAALKRKRSADATAANPVESLQTLWLVADEHRREPDERKLEVDERRRDANERRLEAIERRLKADERRFKADERRRDAIERRFKIDERRRDGNERKHEADERRLEDDKRRRHDDERRRDADERRLEADERRLEADERRLEADERRLEADERRLEAHERSVALFEKAVKLFEASVAVQESAAATLIQINESIKALRE